MLTSSLVINPRLKKLSNTTFVPPPQVTVEKLVRRAFPALGDGAPMRFVHQLDFATSGVLAVGLDRPAAAAACRAFETGAAEKTYLALLEGHLTTNLTVDAPIGRSL